MHMHYTIRRRGSPLRVDTPFISHHAPLPAHPSQPRSRAIARHSQVAAAAWTAEQQGPGSTAPSGSSSHPAASLRTPPVATDDASLSATYESAIGEGRAIGAAAHAGGGSADAATSAVDGGHGARAARVSASSPALKVTNRT